MALADHLRTAAASVGDSACLSTQLDAVQPPVVEYQ